MGVLIVASRHAPPVCEPTHASFRSMARLIPRQVVGPGMRASAPGQNDSRNALPGPPRAEDTAVIGPVREGHTGLGSPKARV